MSRAVLVVRPLLGALLLLLPLLLATAAAADAARVTRLEPTSQWGEYKIRASGFEVGEKVGVRVIGPSEQVIKFDRETADEDGRVKTKIRLPRFAEPGTWRVRLHGDKSDKTAKDTFELPARPPEAKLVVEPAAGPPGMTVTIRGAGFGAGEEVAYWLVAPDGTAVEGDRMLSGGDGGVLFAYAVPADAQLGVWSLAVYGIDSEHLGVVAFTVTPQG